MTGGYYGLGSQPEATPSTEQVQVTGGENSERLCGIREESASSSHTAEQVGDRKERRGAVGAREQRGKVLPEATGRQTVKCTLLLGYTLNR